MYRKWLGVSDSPGALDTQGKRAGVQPAGREVLSEQLPEAPVGQPQGKATIGIVLQRQ